MHGLSSAKVRDDEDSRIVLIEKREIMNIFFWERIYFRDSGEKKSYVDKKKDAILSHCKKEKFGHIFYA